MRVNFSNGETVAAMCEARHRKVSLFGRVAMSSALAIMMMTPIIPIGEATAGSGDQKQSGKHYLVDQKSLQDLKAKVDEMKDQGKDRQHHDGSESGDGSSHGLRLQVTELQKQVSTLSSVNASLVTQLQTAVADIALLRGQMNTLATKSGGSTPAVLAALANYVTVDTNLRNGVKGPHIIFHGANVHIQSGSTMTDDGGLVLTGLGNLFIGYNESPDPSIVYDIAGCDRAVTGSHNLVMGKGNLATSYGSAVVGSQNCVTGQQASILGGEVNEAHADWSTILGGNRWGTYTTKYQTFPVIR